LILIDLRKNRSQDQDQDQKQDQRQDHDQDQQRRTGVSVPHVRGAIMKTAC
jgi:hypothetical protein